MISGVGPMTCEGTILKCSLSELEARRRLQYNFIKSKFEDSEFNASDLGSFRRPYLSKLERDTANELPEVALREYFRAGEFIHVPMVREEKFTIDQFMRFNKKGGKSRKDLSESDLILLTEYVIE